MKDAKQMISVRIVESDRKAVQALAVRLFVRESDIYRFAINHLFSRLDCLLSSSYAGSDLLLALVEIRNELHHTLGLKKNTLEKIINTGNNQPEKYVAMSDIELLLMPPHLLKQKLITLYALPKDKNNIDLWLKEYFSAKYNLVTPKD